MCMYERGKFSTYWPSVELCTTRPCALGRLKGNRGRSSWEVRCWVWGESSPEDRWFAVGGP